MAAIKVFEPSDAEVAAAKAQWSKTPTRRAVTKRTRPAIEGAVWSNVFGGFYPLAWLDRPAVKAVNDAGKPIAAMTNAVRQFRGEPGNVTDYAGHSLGNKRAIEVRFNGRFIKGYIHMAALQTMFAPLEDAPEIDNQYVLLKPGMFYRIPAGMSEVNPNMSGSSDPADAPAAE